MLLFLTCSKYVCATGNQEKVNVITKMLSLHRWKKLMTAGATSLSVAQQITLTGKIGLQLS